jgi:hypothetical protein
LGNPVYLKKRESVDRRVYLLPAPAPIRYSLGEGSTGAFKKILEIAEIPIPTRVAIASGQNPGAVNNYWNNLTPQDRFKRVLTKPVFRVFAIYRIQKNRVLSSFPPEKEYRNTAHPECCQHTNWAEWLGGCRCRNG